MLTSSEKPENYKWPYFPIARYDQFGIILPLFSFPEKAEADHMLLGKLNARTQYEADVMKNVEGWVPGESVFTYRWVPPNEKLHEDIDRTQF
jgi:hypothetical protein